MNVHPIYNSNMFIPDNQRQSVIQPYQTDLTQPKNRKWPLASNSPCDGTKLQTEAHMLITCPLTHDIRANYPMLDISHLDRLFNEESHIQQLCSYVHEVVCFYS